MNELELIVNHKCHLCRKNIIGQKHYYEKLPYHEICKAKVIKKYQEHLETISLESRIYKIPDRNPIIVFECCRCGKLGHAQTSWALFNMKIEGGIPCVDCIFKGWVQLCSPVKRRIQNG